MFEIALEITLNFVDELIGTFSEEEFLLWLEVGGEPSKETLDILKNRLIELEYFEHLITLKNYTNANKK
jgi:hypothetical protein